MRSISCHFFQMEQPTANKTDRVRDITVCKECRHFKPYMLGGHTVLDDSEKPQDRLHACDLDYPVIRYALTSPRSRWYQLPPPKECPMLAEHFMFSLNADCGKGDGMASRDARVCKHCGSWTDGDICHVCGYGKFTSIYDYDAITSFMEAFSWKTVTIVLLIFAIFSAIGIACGLFST